MSSWFKSHGRNKVVVGISSRSPEINLKWLKTFLCSEFKDLVSDVKYLPITNRNRYEWEEAVMKCHIGILYHTKHQGRIHIVDIDGALYDEELTYLSKNLGKHKVMVVLDDLENDSEGERQRILKEQPSIQRLSSQFLIFTEHNKPGAASRGKMEFSLLLVDAGQLSEWKESGISQKWKESGISQKWKESGISQKWKELAISQKFKESETNQDEWMQNLKGSGANQGDQKTSSSSIWNNLICPTSVSIFSRAAENNYKWLTTELRKTDKFRVKDVHNVYISNSHQEFYAELSKCTFAVLYHTKKHGRINITDVTDSLYDTELQDLSQTLGKDNVIVVIDDLQDISPAEKDRILRHQPSISTLSRDLFLFNEKEKNKENLGKIKEIIQKRPIKLSLSNGQRVQAPQRKPGEPSYPGAAMEIKEHSQEKYCSSSDEASSQKYRRLSPISVSIFSRSAENNYKWLSNELRKTDMMRPEDVHSVYISNNPQDFYAELSKCTFAVLYHTQNHGSINITDVTDSLYNTKLHDLYQRLGKDNVIVVIDDLQDSSPAEKDRILRHQPSISTLARDLFLFNEKEKYTENLGTIKEIIQKSVLDNYRQEASLMDFSMGHKDQTLLPKSGQHISPESSVIEDSTDHGSSDDNIQKALLSALPTGHNDQPPQPKSGKVTSAENSMEGSTERGSSGNRSHYGSDVICSSIMSSNRDSTSLVRSCDPSHPDGHGSLSQNNTVLDDDRQKALFSALPTGQNDQPPQTELGKVTSSENSIMEESTERGSSGNRSNYGLDVANSSTVSSNRDPTSYIESSFFACSDIYSSSSQSKLDDSEPKPKKLLLESRMNTQCNSTDIFDLMIGLFKELNNKNPAFSQILENLNIKWPDFEYVMQILNIELKQMRAKLHTQEEEIKNAQCTISALKKEKVDKMRSQEGIIYEQQCTIDTLKKEYDNTIQGMDQRIKEIKDKMYEQKHTIHEMNEIIQENQQTVERHEKKLQDKTIKEQENLTWIKEGYIQQLQKKDEEREHKIQETANVIEELEKKLQESIDNQETTMKEYTNIIEKKEKQIEDYEDLTSDLITRLEAMQSK